VPEFAAEIGNILMTRGWSLVTAESCTGGLIAAMITDVPGSSGYFAGGVVAYSNRIKEDVLSVPGSILDAKGAVSKETAMAMAKGAADFFRVECAVSVTGIAGPGGGSAEKPVGLVYIGLYVPGVLKSFRYNFAGDRASVREQTANTALSLLLEEISK
jgi:PncC family amidohydrolase